ncbi:MAG: signal peptidase I [Microbacteriaceae bacterium]|nr:signal peptidase I [Microbacteriaceae bacterium]
MLIILVIAFLVSFLLKTYLIRSFYIPSSSMEATLQINDRIIVNELVPNAMPLQYGDVVVFRDPGGWLGPQPEPESNWFLGALDWLGSLIGVTASDSNDHLIKRLIGLPGDHVVCCTPTGQLTVNGVPLDEPYLQLAQGQASAPRPFDVTVPDGSLWMMGDNRWNSKDSLGHIDDPGGGFVPVSTVVGKALVISWPMHRWRVLDNYPLTFEGVAAARATASAPETPAAAAAVTAP